MKTRFVRPDTHLFSRIGKGRKKLQKWRRPRGKQNKTRLNRFGYLVQPVIGFGSPRTEVGKIKGLIPMQINEQKDLKMMTKNHIAILARRIGAKKKMEMIKELNDKEFKIFNVGGKK